jgi:hypothetical protein
MCLLNFSYNLWEATCILQIFFGQGLRRPFQLKDKGFIFDKGFRSEGHYGGIFLFFYFFQNMPLTKI